MFRRISLNFGYQRAFLSKIALKEPKTNKILTYFATDKGRFVSFFAIFGCGIQVALFRNALHSQLQGYLEDLNQHFTDGSPTKLSPKLKQILDEVAIELDLSPEEIQNTKVILANVEEPISYGYSKYTLCQKVLLCLPYYFNYGSSDNVDKNVILTDNAKKFGIARELQRASMGIRRLETYFGMVLLCSTYICSRVINTKFNLLRLKFTSRLIPYLSLVLFHFGFMWNFSNSVLRATHEHELDDMIARISENYATGGVEFYAKERDRNLASRDPTEPKVNLKGNVIGSMFFQQVRTTDRMDRCEKIIALHHAGLN